MIHKHKWEIRSAKEITLTSCGTVVDHVTQILRICTVCGKPKVKEIDGTWTLQELK